MPPAAAPKKALGLVRPAWLKKDPAASRSKLPNAERPIEHRRRYVRVAATLIPVVTVADDDEEERPRFGLAKLQLAEAVSNLLPVISAQFGMPTRSVRVCA